MTYTFSSDLLPAGFSYPQDYLKLAQNAQQLDTTSWWLIGDNPTFAELCRETIASKGGSKTLVPFAKDDQSGDLACFDGSNTSGDSRVYFDTGEDDYSEVDWASRYSQTFEEWLDSTSE